MRVPLASRLCFSLALLCGFAPGTQAFAAPSVSITSPQAPWPLYFEANAGQMDSRVSFVARGKDSTIFFTDSGVTLSLLGTLHVQSAPCSSRVPASWLEGVEECAPGVESVRYRWTLRLEFVDANEHSDLVGLEKATTTVSYFRGLPSQWKTALPTYSSIVYKQLWPGIDVVFSGDLGKLKYAFHLAPGANPSLIRIAVRGATGIELLPTGQMEISTPVARFRDERPVAFQESAAGRAPIVADFRLVTTGEFGFRLSTYDPERPLIIDPSLDIVPQHTTTESSL